MAEQTAGERRRHPRIRAYFKTYWAKGKTLRDGIIRDISEGGCFIAALGEVVIGETIECEIALPQVFQMKVKGVIVNKIRGRGFALKFKDLSSTEQALLERFLKHLEELRAQSAVSVGGQELRNDAGATDGVAASVAGVPLATQTRGALSHVRTSLEVKWGIRAHDYSQTGIITGLSQESCHVQSKARPIPGRTIFLHFKSPTGRPFNLEGEVTFYFGSEGFGVRFSKLTERDRESFQLMVDFYREEEA